MAAWLQSTVTVREKRGIGCEALGVLLGLGALDDDADDLAGGVGCRHAGGPAVLGPAHEIEGRRGELVAHWKGMGGARGVLPWLPVYMKRLSFASSQVVLAEKTPTALV